MCTIRLVYMSRNREDRDVIEEMENGQKEQERNAEQVYKIAERALLAKIPCNLLFLM